MHSSKTDHDKSLVADAAPWLAGGIAAYLALSDEKQAMEMTEYGKHEKP
jgi:hypothetical protein